MKFNRKVWCAFAIIIGATSRTLAIAGSYEDCILQNMKGVQVQAAAIAVARACQDKTTPARCRSDEINQRLVNKTSSAPAKSDVLNDRKTNKSVFGAFADLPFSSEVVADELALCLRECAAASYWSRTFGECRTD